MISRKLKLPIPVTILTGSLGVGKTTALCRLIAHKPTDEVWCCIVNEFGAVGIDAAVIQGNCSDQRDVVVKQIAGGCMCCVLSGPLSAAIAQVIRQVKPDRVIIEPSGLGHPGGLIDILQGPHLCSSLQLNAVLCLVDLASFDPAALMSNSVAADQITVADILIGSKADSASPAAVEAFQHWAGEDLFPPKSEVQVISNGNLSSSFLDAPRSAAAGKLIFTQRRRSRAIKLQQYPMHTASPTAAEDQQAEAVPGDASSHAQQQTVGAISNVDTSTRPEPGQPMRVLGMIDDQQYMSCGWVFHQQDRFDQVQLRQLLQDLQPLLSRVKGVFRVNDKQWVMSASRALLQQQTSAISDQQEQEVCQQEITTGVSLEPICYRGSSMVEVIVKADSVPLTTLQRQLAGLVSRLQQTARSCGRFGGDNASGSDTGMMEACHESGVTGDAGEVWCILEAALVHCVRKD